MISKIIKFLYPALIVFLLGFCAAIPLIPLPFRKPIRPVVVDHGCVCGDNFINLRDNWIDANEYIHVLEKAGCFETHK